MRKVIIMQGVPGSGKSTWAKQYRDYVDENTRIVSADNFFLHFDGVYRFDPTQLSAAHGECLRTFLMCIDNGSSTIIVDNTSTTVVEIAPYYAIAEAHGYEVEILRVECDCEQAASRNSHGVPRDSVLRLQANINAFQCPSRWVLKFANGTES